MTIEITYYPPKPKVITGRWIDGRPHRWDRKRRVWAPVKFASGRRRPEPVAPNALARLEQAIQLAVLEYAAATATIDSEDRRFLAAAVMVEAAVAMWRGLGFSDQKFDDVVNRARFECLTKHIDKDRRP